MKNIFPVFAIFLLLTISLSSCGGPIESIESKSPEGDRSIKVTGERTLPGDPITIKVTLTTPKDEQSFKFEHQASSLTKENCTIEWKENVKAEIVFTMDDGEQWVVIATLEDDRMKAYKALKVNDTFFRH